MSFRKVPIWCAPQRRTDGQSAAASSPNRSVFDHDYGIICHSSKFRRLAGKTQVFLAPKSDYPRSRLTHSIEVAQLGRQLASVFRERFEEAFPRSSLGNPGVFERLVETACLAHDLGHPPFGHKGADTLKDLAERLGGQFDDNRHNIHYLFQPDMPVTDVLLDAVMKYKDETLYPKKAPAWYDDDADKCRALLEPLGTKHYRSPACYLMEAADDMINFHSDLEDARKLGIIARHSAAEKHFLQPFGIEPTDDVKKDSSTVLKKLIAHIEGAIHSLIDECRGSDVETFPKCFQDAVVKRIDATSSERLNFFYLPYEGKHTYREIMKNLYAHETFGIIRHEHVTKPERLSGKIIQFIWNEFLQIGDCQSLKQVQRLDCYQLLPSEKKAFLNEHFETLKNDRPLQAKYLSRYISGMTDRYCLQLYKALRQPLDERFEAAIKI